MEINFTLVLRQRESLMWEKLKASFLNTEPNNYCSKVWPDTLIFLTHNVSALTDCSATSICL